MNTVWKQWTVQHGSNLKLNRVEREQGYPEGDPSTSWELVHLQKYCSSHSIDYEESDSKAELVEKIEAA